MIVQGQVSSAIVLDTNIVLHVFFFRYQPAVNWFNSLTNQPLIISAIVINELLYSKPQGGNPPVRKRDLPIVAYLLSNYQIDYPVPQDYTNALARVTRLYGTSKLGFADALIAECALRHHAALYSCDKDFAIIPGLASISPYPCP